MSNIRIFVYRSSNAEKDKIYIKRYGDRLLLQEEEKNRGQGSTRQDRTRQDRTGQHRPRRQKHIKRQDKTGQDKPIQARQDVTVDHMARQKTQGRARQDRIIQDKTRQDVTAQNRA